MKQSFIVCLTLLLTFNVFAAAMSKEDKIVDLKARKIGTSYGNSHKQMRKSSEVLNSAKFNEELIQTEELEMQTPEDTNYFYPILFKNNVCSVFITQGKDVLLDYKTKTNKAYKLYSIETEEAFINRGPQIHVTLDIEESGLDTIARGISERIDKKKRSKVGLVFIKCEVDNPKSVTVEELEHLLENKISFQ